ncbi:MAG TPA: hypothetical protein GX693_00055, partial [Firmicutes bacterium]|nr:hypothetical protein [Bacillota bacterium]
MGIWRQRLILGLMALVVWSAAPTAALSSNIFDELTPEEIAGENFFQLVDEQGKLITVTGHRLRAGDRYLASDNRLYEVSSVEQYTARALFQEQVVLKAPPEASGLFYQAVPVQGSRPSRKIAIYHSHNAESYVPSDGTDSIYGQGGIHAVGRAFRDALTAKGIKVLYSDHMHLPHDRGAYRRSRVTASSLLNKRPDAIFDLHRDAAPPETYSLHLDNEWLTKIQIVVGQDNPYTEVNQGFAFDLKGYSDRIYPGLVKGVLITLGDFNQDLSPLSLLLEVGAHTNSREAAENAIVHFSDIVAYYFYGPRYLPGEPSAAEEEQKPPALYRDAGGIYGAVSGTVLGLLIASLGVALGFYVINEPEALPKTVSYWQSFPGRAARWLSLSKKSLRNFPDQFTRSLREFPGNLEYSWRRLREESRQWRGFARGELPKLKQRAEQWPQYRNILRANWEESWQNLCR